MTIGVSQKTRPPGVFARTTTMHSYQNRRSVIVAVAITFMFVAWLRTDGLRNGESCADAFYHVAI